MKTFAISYSCSPTKAGKDGTAPVLCSISVNGTRKMHTLPYKCKPADFDKERRRGDLKALIDATDAKISKFRTLCEVQDTACTAASVKAYLEGDAPRAYTLRQLCDSFLLTKTSNMRIWQKYRVTKERMFEMWGADTAVDRITRQDIINYYNAHSDFTGETLKAEMKKVKAFFNYAFNSGKINSHPFSGIQFQYRKTEQPFLTYEEVEKIRACELPEEHLSNVRDVFLFMAFTGLEYTDVAHLKKTDINKNKYGHLYIKKNRIKTDVEYVTVLYEDAERIWLKYGGKLPLISNQKTNEHLKTIAARAGILKNVTTLTARHTFATYALSERILPVDIVQRMLGHTTPAQSLHYAKMLDATVFAAAAASTRMTRAGRKR